MYGKEVAKSLHDVKDLRLDEYNSYPDAKKKALIRLGTYTMLLRAGYNVSPVKETMDKDADTCKDILEGKQLLFSPYQTLHCSEVDEALGRIRTVTEGHSNVTVMTGATRTDEQSTPIEIKSPTEETHLSLKAIRQALENKVVLLSRETYHTCPETTSLVVGYYLPNDRAEVTNLINDFKTTYGYRIGVLDLKTILTMGVTIIIDNKTFDITKFNRMEGYATMTMFMEAMQSNDCKEQECQNGY